MEKRKLIFDCDPGHDDIMAIMNALAHPELSFPWNVRITHLLYGLYADAVVLLFALAFLQKSTGLHLLSILIELGAVFFLEQSILTPKKLHRCQVCGKDFLARSGRAKYCRECVAKVHRQQKTKSARRRRSGVDN